MTGGAAAGARRGNPLAFRNYRLFFVGQGISLAGSWVARVATSWAVYDLTRSTWQLGLVTFVGLAPTVLLSPVAGVLADRWDRRRTLVATQVVFMLLAAAVAVLAFADRLAVWHLFAVQLGQGIVVSLDTPARQAFLTDMVEDRAALPRAIALNSSLFNGSRLVGPAIGGALLAAGGVAWCFAIDALSFIAVIASLLAMRLDPHVTPAPHAGGLRGAFGEGLAFVRASPVIRALLLLIALVGTFGAPYNTLLPAFASEQLRTGPGGYGAMTTAGGVGALAATLLLARRRSVQGLGRWIERALVVFGLALGALAVVHVFWPVLAILAVLGGALVLAAAAANTILQTIVPDALRGRVLALYGVAFLGSVPVGSLLAGAAATRIGTTATLAAAAVCTLALALWFARLRPMLDRELKATYRDLGILRPTGEHPIVEA
jgi:MFS family permease